MNKKTLAFTIGLTILSLTSTNIKAVDQGTMDKLNKYPVVRKELKEFSRPITINLQKGDQVIRIDNKFKDGVRVLDGRTSIGVRDLVNAIEGAEVTWNQQNKIVDIVKDGKNIAYPLNRMAMYDGNAIVTMDTIAGVDPKISRTFVPIRNLAESLGYEVDWDNATSTVTLRTPGSKPIAKPQAQKPQATVGKGGTAPVPYGPKKLDMTQSAGRKVVGKTVRGKNYLGYLTGEVIDNGDGTSTYFPGTNNAGYLHNPFKRVDSSPANPNFNVFGPNTGDNRVGTAVITKGNDIWTKIHNLGIESAKKTDTYNPLKDDNNITLTNWVADGIFKGAGDTIFKGRKLNAADIGKLNSFISQHNRVFRSNYENEWYDGTGIVDARITGVTTFSRQSGKTFLLNSNAQTFLKAFIDVNGDLYGVNGDDEFIFPESEFVVIDKVLVCTTYQNIIVDVPNIRIEGRDRGNYSNVWTTIKENYADVEGSYYER